MRINKATMLLVPTCVCAFACATVPRSGSDEPAKVGIVDLDHALISTDEGKKASDEIKHKQQEAEAEVRPLVEKYKALEQEIKTQKSVMSSEELRDKQRDLVSMRNNVEIKLKQEDNDLKVEAERIRGPLVKKMVEIVKAIGKDQGYTVILTRGAGGLIYNNTSIEITDIVVQRFNKEEPSLH